MGSLGLTKALSRPLAVRTTHIVRPYLYTVEQHASQTIIRGSMVLA